MIRRAPLPTLFPYTTLFRSKARARERLVVALASCFSIGVLLGWSLRGRPPSPVSAPADASIRDVEQATGRSEEHTSELQSHSDLVCRLLLEKKKNKTSSNRL